MSLPKSLILVGAVSLAVVGVMLADTSEVAAEEVPGVEWSRQFGTSGWEWTGDIAVDASGIYVTGTTSGVFPGQSGAGRADAFVRKYDTAGNRVWTRQFGTSEDDWGEGIAIDATGVYVSGYTAGVLPGQRSAGGDWDGFVRKYNRVGDVLWTRQFGTSESDSTHAIAADPSGVYVTGFTDGAFPDQALAGEYDAYVRRYDAGGSEVWTRQFGTSEYTFGSDVAVDASGIYVTGGVTGSFPGFTNDRWQDAFVRKYDAGGDEMWTHQFGGSTSEGGQGIVADVSGIYVTGSTGGAFPGQINAGERDGFIRKLDTAGSEVWTRQFGTDLNDSGTAVAVNSYGVFVTGITSDRYTGDTKTWPSDGFLRAYDTSGNQRWTHHFGTSLYDTSIGVAVVDTEVYVAGDTFGVFPGQINAGEQDMYVRRHGDNVAVCMGYAVTIAGTSAGETLKGTDGDDVIDARGGDDVVYGYGGNDVICGGGGDDALYGGPGTDRLVDTRGVNVFHGGDGDDDIRAGGASSEVYAEAGNDTVRTWALVGYVDGGLGDDDLGGSYHPETFIGGDGHDTIRPHDGRNEVHGGPGNDDIWTQGAGNDQVIDGGPGNDLIRADQGNDILMGGDGDDIIYGRKGNDTIDGGAGNDELWGHQGNDAIHGGDGNDVITGWGGKDRLWGDGGDDTLFGGDHADMVVGGDGADRLVGGFGNDQLDGGAGDDIVNGRDGNDELHGREGADLLKGGPGDDELWGEADNDDLRGAKGHDVLWAGDGNDILRGHAMNDFVHGGGGDDLLYGGTGTDHLDGAEGTDTLDGGYHHDECTNGETYKSCEMIL